MTTEFEKALDGLIWTIRSGGSYETERANVVALYEAANVAKWDEHMRVVAELAAERQRAEGLRWFDKDRVRAHLDQMAVSSGLWDGDETRSFKIEALMRYIEREVSRP